VDSSGAIGGAPSPADAKSPSPGQPAPDPPNPMVAGDVWSGGCLDEAPSPAGTALSPETSSGDGSLVKAHPVEKKAAGGSGFIGLEAHLWSPSKTILQGGSPHYRHRRLSGPCGFCLFVFHLDCV
jgi:hypothetical protein